MNTPPETAAGLDPSVPPGSRLPDSFVMPSPMPWDHRWPTSRHHIARELVRRGKRVLFIEPPPQSLGWYRRAVESDGFERRTVRQALARSYRSVMPGLDVLSAPPVFPFQRLPGRLFSLMLGVDRAIYRRTVRRVLADWADGEFVLFNSFDVYFGGGLLGRLGERYAIYHCTDVFGAFPGRHRLSQAVEVDVASRSDLVITSSRALAAEQAEFNPRTIVVLNGVDYERFAVTAGGDSAAAEIPPPRIGMIGQIDYRNDIDLIVELAGLRPEWRFVAVGHVTGVDPSVFEPLPNLHLLSPVPYDEVPGLMADLDVALIPYGTDALGRGIYPLKLNEYLAAAVPVVATPLPDLVGHPGVRTAPDAPGLAAAIEEALALTAEEREQLRPIGRQASWSTRVDDMLAQMEVILLGAR